MNYVKSKNKKIVIISDDCGKSNRNGVNCVMIMVIKEMIMMMVTGMV